MDSSIIILRPRTRVARLQLLALGGIAGVAIPLVAIFGERFDAVLLSAIAIALIGGVVAYYRHWMRHSAPAAMVATSEYVALLGRDGARAYVPWSSVTAAKHATTLGGMRWYLHTSGPVVTLCDIGVHSDRWGILWRAIWPEVARRGAPVHVDALSNAFFD